MKGVEEAALDGAFERAGAIHGVVAFAGEVVFGGGGEVQRDLLGGESFHEPGELEIDDVGEVGVGEAVEDDDFVDAVEEFGAEVAVQGVEGAGMRIAKL